MPIKACVIFHNFIINTRFDQEKYLGLNQGHDSKGEEENEDELEMDIAREKSPYC